MQQKTEFKLPKIYFGICEKSKQGNSNINKYWVECDDGNYRSETSNVILCQNQVDADVKKGYLKQVL